MPYKFFDGFDETGNPAKVRVVERKTILELLDEFLFVRGRESDPALAALLAPLFREVGKQLIVTNIPVGVRRYIMEGTVADITRDLTTWYSSPTNPLPYYVGLYNAARTGDDRILFCATILHKKELSFARSKRTKKEE